MVLYCDRFDRGSRQAKREPVDLVTEDYDVLLCQRIACCTVEVVLGIGYLATLVPVGLLQGLYTIIVWCEPSSIYYCVLLL